MIITSTCSTGARYLYQYGVPVYRCGPISVWSSLTSQPRNALSLSDPSHGDWARYGTMAPTSVPRSAAGALSGGAHPMGDTPTISGSIVSYGWPSAWQTRRRWTSAVHMSRSGGGRNPASAACPVRLGPEGASSASSRPSTLTTVSHRCELGAKHTHTRAGMSALGATLSAGRQFAMGRRSSYEATATGGGSADPTGHRRGHSDNTRRLQPRDDVDSRC
jgi:hypothetical protein